MPTAKLYLPKTADNYVETVNTVKRRMADAFGGYTAYDAEGGWVDDEGETVTEPVTVLETAATPDVAAADMAFAMRVLARDVKTATGEDTIMIVVEGDKYLA